MFFCYTVLVGDVCFLSFCMNKRLEILCGCCDFVLYSLVASVCYGLCIVWYDRGFVGRLGGVWMLIVFSGMDVFKVVESWVGLYFFVLFRVVSLVFGRR